EDIRSALASFIPSSNQTPGRLNFFHFRQFTMLADFAHNPHGLRLLVDFISKLDYPYKVGVISGTGDRRDDDIRELARISANFFDEIIIRCDKNLRGRSAEEIIGLLEEGIAEVKPDMPVLVIQNENEALEYVYKNYKPGALYTVLCDVVSGALDKIKELKERDEKSAVSGPRHL
ncbi:MAG: cyanophycin synthetase, partial [Gemmatimonadaceae bacterium]|nr:cyanophycin synthetase [Chitinophagaceae bacterium]